MKMQQYKHCLLYTSDAADDKARVDLGGRRIIKKIFFKQKTAYEIRLSLVGSEMCIRDSHTKRAGFATLVGTRMTQANLPILTMPTQE